MSSNRQNFYNYSKRLFDIIVALISLVLLTPLFVIIAILIKLDSKGPILFLHDRVGYNNVDIKILKFRTMHVNAENMINSFDERMKKEWEANYKIENDPRVTKIGKILRKTSIDELPQLVNILFGNLSIVGPRPVIRDELKKKWSIKEQKKLLSVKPGLTGYWATHGRSATTYAERKKLELYYVNHASLWLDIKIIVCTIPSLISTKGAK